MKDEQVAVITAYMAGIQASIVHLANVVAHSTGVDKDDLATSFEETANRIPPEVMHRELIQTSILQIAKGIRGAAAGPEWDDLMSKLTR